MDKTQINLERMRANDADWEEQKHPRAKNGQFTSGSGSAGGASKPSAEPTAGSPLKKAAAAVKGSGASGKGAGGFAYTPENKKDVIATLKRDMDNFGSNSAVGKVNASLLSDLEGGKSFTEAVNNAKAKYKGKGEEYDAQLYNFYVASKGPQWNENFMKEYGDKGSDYRSRKQALEKEAEAWMNETAPAPKKAAPKKAAAPKKSNVLTGYKGKTYTQGITGAGANTPAGEVHNLIVGRIESTNPTKAEIAEAAWYIADEDLNDEVRRCREMVKKFERDGNGYAAKAWSKSLKTAQKKVEICKEIAKSMSAKDSASPLQQAAAILQSE